MNTILHFAANFTNSTYDDHCWNGKEMYARNFCYARVLKYLGNFISCIMSIACR
jgi:hypothetical protein